MGHRAVPRVASDGPMWTIWLFPWTRISGCLTPIGILPQVRGALAVRHNCGALPKDSSPGPFR
jgi:hypothetical protein